MHDGGVKNEPLAADERTWLILQRDLSVWLRKVRTPTFMTLVLDLTDERSRAAEGGVTVEESLRAALTKASKDPIQGLKPTVPDRIQVPHGMMRPMASVLSAIGLLPTLPQSGREMRDIVIEEVTPEDGAEWVFDDIITKLAGRQPPDERLMLEDATLLYEQARRFMEAAPWQRLTADDALLVELKIGSQRVEGIATVIGSGPTVPGLMLTPGREAVSPASVASPPPGTLLMQLEGAEGWPDLFHRARRYGWPTEAAVTPSFISMGGGGFRELDRRESWPLALVLAGVAKYAEEGKDAVFGNLELPDRRRGRYHVSKAPEPKAQKPRGDLLGIKVSTDLMPNGSDVQIGHLDIEALSAFRQEADVVVPARVPFATRVKSVPIITLSPRHGRHAEVVDRLKRARPLGATVFDTPDGPMLTVIGERAGFALLNDPRSTRVWKQNIRASDGAHVLMVTDVTNEEEPDPHRPGRGTVGRIHGLFECVLRAPR